MQLIFCEFRSYERSELQVHLITVGLKLSIAVCRKEARIIIVDEIIMKTERLLFFVGSPYVRSPFPDACETILTPLLTLPHSCKLIILPYYGYYM